MSEVLTSNSLSAEIRIDESLSLRLFEPDDSQELFQILQAAPEIQDYVTWTAGIESPEDVATKIRGFQEKGEPRYALLEDEGVIGYVALYISPTIDDEYEIGYFCEPDKRGKGIIPKAVTGFMKTVQETLPVKSFGLFIADENASSQAVAAKLGFVRTHGLREDKTLQCTERRYVRQV